MGAVVIAVTNGKGGVAKTTTAKMLIYELLSRGKKVLAIDMDSKQSNLTIGFGLEPYPNAPKNTDNMSDVDRERQSHLAYGGDHNLVKIFQGGIKPTPFKVSFVDNLWVIPAAKELESVANACPSSKDLRLKQYIKTIENDFDYIIIDTNPGITVLINNAVMYADKLVMPAQAEVNAAEGMKAQLSDVGSLMTEYDTDKPSAIFIVPSMITKRSKTHSLVLADLTNGLEPHIKTIPSLKDKKIFITESVPQRELFRLADLAEGCHFVQEYIIDYDQKERKLHKDDAKNGTSDGLLTIIQHVTGMIIDK